MKTFDVSVNVLNNNVLSDKLLWKERQVSSSKAVDRPVEVVVQQVDTEAPVCHWRPPELRLEMLLLWLPFACVMSFIIVFELSSNKPLISTLVGCALVLSTPAILMLVHQRRNGVKNDIYVHVLLLHAAGLFTILNHKAIICIFLVFAVVFAYLAWQTFVRRSEHGKDITSITSKVVVYLFVSVVNAIVVALLIFYRTQLENSSMFTTDILCVIVFMSSLSIYVSHNYI